MDDEQPASTERAATGAAPDAGATDAVTTGDALPQVERPLDAFDADGEDGIFRTGGQNEVIRDPKGDAQGPSSEAG